MTAVPTLRAALRRALAPIAALLLLPAATIGAQVTTAASAACTRGDFVACARVDVTSTVQGGSTLLTLDIRNLDVTGPSLFYAFSFATGRDATDPVDLVATPSGLAAGAAEPAWLFADFGDSFGLAYLPSFAPGDEASLGVGGSIAGVDDQGQFRQIGTTNPGAIGFSVLLPYLFGDAAQLSIAGLEAVRLDDRLGDGTLRAGSCSPFDPSTACTALPLDSAVVPEPATVTLLAGGLLVLGAAARRRTTRTREVA